MVKCEHSVCRLKADKDEKLCKQCLVCEKRKNHSVEFAIARAKENFVGDKESLKCKQGMDYIRDVVEDSFTCHCKKVLHATRF
jgi:hypothetical protein